MKGSLLTSESHEVHRISQLKAPQNECLGWKGIGDTNIRSYSVRKARDFHSPWLHYIK